jgi:hypothetical protein
MTPADDQMAPPYECGPMPAEAAAVLKVHPRREHHRCGWSSRSPEKPGRCLRRDRQTARETPGAQVPVKQEPQPVTAGIPVLQGWGVVKALLILAGTGRVTDAVVARHITDAGRAVLAAELKPGGLR